MTAMEYAPPADTGLDIIYRDEHLIALDKPAGLLSVPGRGSHHADCLASRVQQRLPTAQVVHRLDMSTSGIMIMALTSQVHRALNQMFQQRKVDKCYSAVVTGRPTPASGAIKLPLIADWPNRPRQMVDHEHGKMAETRYTVIGFDEQTANTRIQLMPVTGRTHQLRVHMQAIGHAILGDDLYAGEEVRRMASRLLLHATRLAFNHPVTDQPIRLYSPAPF